MSCLHENAEIQSEAEYENRRFEDPQTHKIVNEPVLVSFRAVLHCPACGLIEPMKVVSHQKPQDVS
ncbi:MAG: hypothetical protein ACYCW6_08610 [Candidatus Xenobia bacterium]